MRDSKPNQTLSNWLWIGALLAVGVILLIGLPATAADRAVAARTLRLGFSASLIAIPLGCLISWICLSKGFAGKALLLTCIAMLFVPMFVHVSGWDAAFGKLGWLTSTQGEVLKPLISGWTAAIWIHGCAAAPQVALILLLGLSTGNRIYEEQALLDTTASGVFWHVTFRRIWPLLLLSFLWIIVSCAREIAVTDLYQVGTLAEQIYLGYSLGINSIPGTWTPSQLAEAGSLGPSLTISIIGWLGLVSLFLFIRLTDLEYQSDQIRPHNISGADTENSGKLKSVLGLAIIFLLALVPTGNTIVRACFRVVPVDGVPTQGYSVSQLFNAVNKSAFDYREEFVWSSLISLVAASLIVGIATVFSSFARRSKPFQFLFAVSLAATCALPGPYIGTSLASWFANLETGTWLHWLYNYTIAAPVVANSVFCWPVGALLVWFAFRKIPEDSLESARTEGAGAIKRFFSFGLASNWKALIGCWLISFALSFGELSASHMVRPAGMDTVPRKMLGDLHAGVNEMTAGITIVTAFTIVSISLIGWAFIRLNRRSNNRK